MLSTMSFTVDKHYCGDYLVDIAIFKEAKTCGMKVVESSAECGDNVMKASCCTNEQILVEGQDDIQDNVVELTYEQQLFLTSFIYAVFDLYQPNDTSTSKFLGHPPPLLKKDFQVLYETFLI